MNTLLSYVLVKLNSWNVVHILFWILLWIELDHLNLFVGCMNKYVNCVQLYHGVSDSKCALELKIDICQTNDQNFNWLQANGICLSRRTLEVTNFSVTKFHAHGTDFESAFSLWIHYYSMSWLSWTVGMSCMFCFEFCLE